MDDEIEAFLWYAKKVKWRKSKNYKPPFDHEYFLIKDNVEAFRFMKRVITARGFDAMFLGKYKTRYFVVDGYRYWAYETVLNRDLDSKWRGGFPKWKKKGEGAKQVSLFRDDSSSIDNEID